MKHPSLMDTLHIYFMKHFAFIIALFAVINNSYSQDYKGEIIDELTQEPIVGATIRVKNKDIKSFCLIATGLFPYSESYGQKYPMPGMLPRQLRVQCITEALQ